MYDFDMNDVISRGELVTILKSVDKMNGGRLDDPTVYNRVDRIFKHCDKNLDDKLNLKEFLQSGKLEPIADMFKDRHVPFERNEDKE